MKPVFLLAGSLSLSFSIQAQVLRPHAISLGKTLFQVDSTQGGLQSNAIFEIKTQGDSLVWLGTGEGLSFMRDSATARTFYSSSELTSGQTTVVLPKGGASALGVAGRDTLLASFADTKNGVATGSGLALSYDSRDTAGVSWVYFSQPIDSSGDSTLTWGGVSIKALPVTVPEKNVTYDIAVSNGYFWITSWAGGLRRLNQNSIGSGWERVPLPEDGQADMLCGEKLTGYELNPRDPPAGNHNHKGFSVLAYGDTVWVGTADGINRGILDESGCVDWQHYSYPLAGISGNWVVSLAKQEWKGQRKIWAVTLMADQLGEESGVSYTPDDGLTWYSVPVLQGERGYNLFVLDSLIYVAAESGLWKSRDGVNFARFKPAVDAVSNDQIVDNDVFAVFHDRRPYYGDVLWIGTGDGLARNLDPDNSATGKESTWRIVRTNVTPGKLYAYPNPFSPYINNILEGDGYVRFHLPASGKGKPRGREISLRIYNFAMESVRTLSYNRGAGEGILKWDGKDDGGISVANGTYFCDVFYDQERHWIKIVVVK